MTNQTTQETVQNCEEFVEKLLIPTFDEDAKSVLGNLKTVVGNVLKEPGNEKFRRISTGNKVVTDMLDKYPQALEFLDIVGFESHVNKDSKDYVLPPGKEDPRVLETGLTVLNKHMQSLDLSSDFKPPNQEKEVEGFSTTASSVIRLGTEIPNEHTNSKLEQKVDALQADRDEALMKAGIPERSLRIYDRFSEAKQAKKFSSSSSTKGDAALIKQVAEANHEMVEKQRHFRTKAMRDYDFLTTVKLYTKTVIKVQFPDDMMFEAHFSPLEKLTDVEAELKKCFRSSEKADFFLFKRLRRSTKLDPSATLKELGLVPSGRLMLAWKETPEGEYLKDQFVETVNETESKASKQKGNRKSLFSLFRRSSE